MKPIGQVDFETFYLENYPAFLSVACRYIADREICRDIIQDIFALFWNNINNFDDPISAKVFFYRSIRNECINRINHSKVHRKYFERQLTIVQSDEFLLDTIIREESAYIVHQNLKSLSPSERRVILMAMDDIPNAKIAEELSISINTVKTLKARAYVILRNSLRELRFMVLSF